MGFWPGWGARMPQSAESNRKPRITVPESPSATVPGEGLPAAPRPCNTGGKTRNQLRVSLDWLEWTCHGEELRRPEREWFREVGVDEWLSLDHGRNGYRRSDVAAAGPSVLWSEGVEHVHVAAPGAWLRGLAEPELSGVLLHVREAAIATRVDLAGDDESRGVLPSVVYECFLRGDAVTRARYAQEIRSISPDGVGSTFTLGKRGNSQYLRVYDRTPVTKGESTAIRWELECRDEVAQTLVRELCTEDWGTVFGRRLVSFVDFREGLGEVRKRPRSGWFHTLIGSAVRAGSIERKRVTQLDSALWYMGKQWGPTMAAKMEEAGGDTEWLYRMIGDGRTRLTDAARFKAVALAKDRENGKRTG